MVGPPSVESDGGFRIVLVECLYETGLVSSV